MCGAAGAAGMLTSSLNAAISFARRDARHETDDEYKSDEDQRSGPRLGVPVVVWADGIVEDLERQRRDGLPDGGGPEVVAERREQERRRLAGDARDGDERAGDDAPQRGAEHDGQRRAPPGIPERQRGLAQRDR